MADPKSFHLSSEIHAYLLDHDGTLLCCDVSHERTAIARRDWERAGVDAKSTLRIGPASPSSPVSRGARTRARDRPCRPRPCRRRREPGLATEPALGVGRDERDGARHSTDPTPT